MQKRRNILAIRSTPLRAAFVVMTVVASLTATPASGGAASGAATGRAPTPDNRVAAAVRPLAARDRVPGAPVALTSQAADRQLAVQWRAAAPFAGAVTGYRVSIRAFDNRSRRWSAWGDTVLPASSRTRVWTDLVNGHTYQVRVLALNRFGAGPSRDTAAVVGPTATGAGKFVSLGRVRLLDSRANGNTVDRRYRRIGPTRVGRRVTVPVVGRGGLPRSGVRSLLVTATITGTGTAGRVWLWAGGEARPLLASIGAVPAGGSVRVQRVVPIGSAGSVSIQTSARLHLVLEVTAYAGAGAGSARYTVPTNTRLYVAGDVSSASVRAGSVSLTIDAAAIPPVTGGHIALAPVAQLPDGMFARVTGTRRLPDGSTTAHLVRAPIGEVFSDVQVNFDRPAVGRNARLVAPRSAWQCRTAGSPAGIDNLLMGDSQGPVSVQWQQTRVRHSFSSGNAADRPVSSMSFSFAGEAVASLSIQAKRAFGCELTETFRRANRFELEIASIGPVPIRLQLEPAFRFDVLAPGRLAISQRHFFSMAVTQNGVRAPQFTSTHRAIPLSGSAGAALEASLFAGGDLALMLGGGARSATSEAAIAGSFGPQLALVTSAARPSCLAVSAALRARLAFQLAQWTGRWRSTSRSLSTSSAFSSELCAAAGNPPMSPAPSPATTATQTATAAPSLAPPQPRTPPGPPATDSTPGPTPAPTNPPPSPAPTSPAPTPPAPTTPPPIPPQPEPQPGPAIRVRFQSIGATTPPGSLADWGQKYGQKTGANQGSGSLAYGWVSADTGTALDLTKNGRVRTSTPTTDPLLTGLMHMDWPASAGSAGTAVPGSWEAAVANGHYRVTVSAGDADSRYRNSVHQINIEDQNSVAQTVLSDEDRFRSVQRTVYVSDGRLTLTSTGGSNTKINYVEYAKYPDGAVMPRVAAVTPTNLTTGAIRDLSVTAGLVVSAGGIDTATLNESTVRLTVAADGSSVPANVNTSAAGDVIVLTPKAELVTGTTYRFDVTSAVRDVSGYAFAPWSSVFTVGTTSEGTGMAGVAFEQLATPAAGQHFTSVTMGPDSKLYAATLDGVLFRYPVSATGALGSGEQINTVVTHAGGPRTIIGLAFDPASTASNLVLWITENRQYLGDPNVPDWTGKIVRLSGSALQNAEDVVVGLPRSARDHESNSLAFKNGLLYLTQGSNTAMGAPDVAWTFREESLLSAAVLRLDPALLPAGLPLNVKTADGGSYDPYAAGAPLTLYATGVRNAYDLVWHSNGRLYVPTNGSARGGNLPGTPAALPASCARRIDSASRGAWTGPAAPRVVNNPVDETDWVFRVAAGGYYGHPNPARCEWAFNGGNPSSAVDPFEASEYPVGVLPDRNYRRDDVFDAGLHASANGTIEYLGDSFGTLLKHKLIVVRYSASQDLMVLDPSGEGGTIVSRTLGVTGFKNFNQPLDVAQHPASGNIYVTELGGMKITRLVPRP